MDKEIIIDLKRASDAQLFDSEELIQQEALYKLKELMLTIYESSKRTSRGGNCSEKHVKGKKYMFDIPRYHYVITIDGERGSGKSTFILNAFELIRNGKLFEYRSENEREKESERELKCKIKPLGIIDPTLTEGGQESIFISIVSRVKMAVEECLDASESHARIEWQNKLNELARGLSSMKGIGTETLKGELWDDHQYILQEGLVSADHGAALEYNFHQFVEESLKVLDMKAFILAFDDIDTAFESGWPVLEVIRKYLTTPKLMVVLSGDLELYSLLVRKALIKNFGKELLESDKINSKLEEMIDSLEDQYLLKLLKTDYRIKLETLGYYNEKYNINLIHPKEDEGNKLALNKVLETMFHNMFYIGSQNEPLHIGTVRLHSKDTKVENSHFEQLYGVKKEDINNPDLICAHIKPFYYKLKDQFKTPNFEIYCNTIESLENSIESQQSKYIALIYTTIVKDKDEKSFPYGHPS